MKAALVALAFAGAYAVPALAAPMTVKGELVDQACFTKDKANRGDSHKDCGSSCAKKGAPLALVTADGDIYTITGDFAANKNAKLVDHFAHTVEVTGEVTEAEGKKSIAVTALKMAS